jgi:ABC-type branched-subunit amino acid transport system permease subunit
MSLSMKAPSLFPDGDSRKLLLKWIIALIVPVVVFTLWAGEAIINTVVSPGTAPSFVATNPGSLVQGALFTAGFYLVPIAFAGYLVATDSGRSSLLETWIDVFVFTLVPLLLVSNLGLNLGLIIGLAVSAIVWVVYFYVKRWLQRVRTVPPSVSLARGRQVQTARGEQAQLLMQRGILGGFWFAVTLDVIWLILDLVYFFSGQLSTAILIWVIARTILLPFIGYAMGRLAGAYAIRRASSSQKNAAGVTSGETPVSTASSNGRRSAPERVMSDLPLRSKGAQRFLLTLLIVFLLFYPVIDPFLFGSGTDGRLAGYGDAGYYVILALGLNIVVGFAGLLDLGYVAFFAIGSYVWGMIGSHQFTIITGIPTNLQVVSWLFWPMLIVTALIASFWGVLLGAPTLRLRGDYLAIVTLGFGEIVPVVFLELDKYTNGANGIVGVQPPAFPGVDWTTSTPYYYLILALIVLVIFANLRLRDSRLGRAWVAIREDEIAAASSGVNLVNTKLFAFAAGAFFSGIAGAYHAAKLGGVSPDNFSFGDSVIYLAMVVIGGIGSIPGVIVGALVVYALNEFILAQLDTIAADPSSIIHPIYAGIVHVVPGFTFGNVRNLIFGVVLVIIMIFRPEGLIPSARRRMELRRTGEEEMVEIGSLDVPPGSAEFESEMRVE